MATTMTALPEDPESGTIAELPRWVSDASSDSVATGVVDRAARKTDRQRQQFGNQMENLDAQMHEAKNFLCTLNRNMGVQSGSKYNLANFMFLAVVFGIEYDMTGFVCSIATYWGYEMFVLRLLLIFFSISFAAPLALHYYFMNSGTDSDSPAPGAPPRVSLHDTRHQGASSSHSSAG